MKPTLFPAVTLTALLAAGCVHHHRYSASQNTSVTAQSTWAKEDQTTFQYAVRDGHAVLLTDRVTLVFHDTPAKQRDAFHFQGTSQAVQTGGEATSSVTVICRRNETETKFISSYANGTNTLQFGNDTIQFANRGKLLLVGGKEIDLSAEPKVVSVHKQQATVN